jgi:hypothetical protein
MGWANEKQADSKWVRVANEKPDQFTVETLANPFQQSQRLILSLPQKSYIDLSIQDRQGNILLDIYRGEQNAGIYNLDWQTDELNSGVYYFRIKVDSSSTTLPFAWLDQ